MTNFEFVFSLFTLLLGLALAEVLGGFGNALQSRRKVRIGWLTPLLGTVVAFDLVSYWTIAWSVRAAMLPGYLVLLYALLVTALYYLIARIVFPRDLAEWPDLDAYYFAHKRLVFGGYILCNVLAFSGQALLGHHPFPSWVEATALILFAMALVLLWAKGKRLNLVLLAAMAAIYPFVGALGLGMSE